MSEDKIHAIHELMDTPKNVQKQLFYEKKLNNACLDLLFACRKIITSSWKNNKGTSPLSPILKQLKARVDSLIDRMRLVEVRLRPGTSDKTKKIILNNAIIYDFILFSKAWDLRTSFNELEAKVMFGENLKAKKLAKDALDLLQAVSQLLIDKEHLAVTINSTEEIAEKLSRTFAAELALTEQAGALKGIITLDKPKLFGKNDYYEQLSNIILRIISSFGSDDFTEPIAVRAIFTRFKEDYPRINADTKDVSKAIEELANNGLIYLRVDRNGLKWIQLTPSESEANIILNLAKKKGVITLEEIVLATNWSVEKTLEEMEKFVKAGSAIQDKSYASGTKYYFPGLSD